MLHKALRNICEALGKCEAQLNQLDTQSGDGDCGTTLKRGTDGKRLHSFVLTIASNNGL